MQQLLPAAEKLEAAEENCDSRITADSTFKPKPLVHKSLNQSLAIELVKKKTDNDNKFNAPRKNSHKISSSRTDDETTTTATTTNRSDNMFKVKLRPSSARPSLGHWGGAKKAKSKKTYHLNEQ